MTEPTNFTQAYAILKQNAQLLENTDTLDIDELLKIVEQSVGAYKICQTRIKAVEEALQQTFEQLD